MAVFGSTKSGIYSVLDDERLVADFFNNLGAAKDRGFSERLATEIPSDSEHEHHAWLGMVAPMREWLGTAIGRELATYQALLRNIDYETTLHIQKGDLRRDKTGGIRRRIAQLGAVAGRQKDIRISNLVDNGETASGSNDGNFRDLSGRAYDNQAFFDTDHSESGSNQTNDLTNIEVPSADVSTPGAPTVSEMQNIITETIGHLYSLTDDQGEPINGDLTNFMVMVSQNDYWKALIGAVNNLLVGGGDTNTLANMVGSGMLSIDPRFNPRLPNENKVWIFATLNNDVADTGPFIWQEEVPIGIDETDPGPDTKYIKAMAHGTHAAGYGMWQRGALVALS